jgi:hypothetical protein
VTLDVWNGYYGLDSANQQLIATASLNQIAAATAHQLRNNAELNWKLTQAQLGLALGRLSNAEPLENGVAVVHYLRNTDRKQGYYVVPVASSPTLTSSFKGR